MQAYSDPATMTNGQLEKEQDKLITRGGEIAQAMINGGFGYLRPSDMRDNPDCHPLAREDLAIMARMRELGAEIDRRYGKPGAFASLLVYSQGKGYRRIKG